MTKSKMRYSICACVPAAASASVSVSATVSTRARARLCARACDNRGEDQKKSRVQLTPSPFKHTTCKYSLVLET